MGLCGFQMHLILLTDKKFDEFRQFGGYKHKSVMFQTLQPYFRETTRWSLKIFSS